MMNVRITSALRILLDPRAWRWRFSRMGREVRAAEKIYAAERIAARRRRDRQLLAALGPGPATWGPEELERRRSQVALVADLMATLPPGEPTAPEEVDTRTASSLRASVAGGRQASAGSLPSQETRSNVGVIDQESFDDTEAEQSGSETLVRTRRYWMSLTAVAVAFLSVFGLSHGFGSHRAPTAVASPPGLAAGGVRDGELDSSAFERPGPGGAYETALQIQIAEYRGAGTSWCLLADPGSKDCVSDMQRNFAAHGDARRSVLLVTSSIGEVSRDRTSVEILLRLGGSRRHTFPLQWVDGRWRADPLTIPAAKANGGFYTKVVADALYDGDDTSGPRPAMVRGPGSCRPACFADRPTRGRVHSPAPRSSGLPSR